MDYNVIDEKYLINFFTNLKDSDWDILVTSKWRVKDVLAHLVGWEQECVKELPKAFKGNCPWFMTTENFDNFNNEIYQAFVNYPKNKLIDEFIKVAKKLDEIIKEIGEENIRKREDLHWVFDEGGSSHFEHHLKQIQTALNRKF